VLHDCCAAATMDLHNKELEIINMIYCHVMSSDELRPMLQLPPRPRKEAASQ
jgi:hypothetical protein